MRKSDELIAEIKQRLPFPVLFRTLHPEHYRECGNSRCFKHDDSTESLELYDDHGICWAGCTPDGGKADRWDVIDLWRDHYAVDFMTAVRELAVYTGITNGENRPAERRIAAPEITNPAKSQKKKFSKPLGKEEATYVYRDENAQPLFQVIRYRKTDGSKDFRQQRFWKGQNGGAGWEWGTRGVRRVLYRLPELLAAPKEQPEFLVEGEKDADNVSILGLVATTYPMGADKDGAKKWDKLVRDHRIHEPLRDRHVVVVPDNDAPGRNTANHIARTLVGFAASVKIVILPDLPEKGDISDFIEQHGPEKACELLLQMIAETEPLTETERLNRQEDTMSTHTNGNPEQHTEISATKPSFTQSEAAEKATELRDAIGRDRGAALEDGNLALMESLQNNHLSEWARTKEILGKHHLVRDVEKALKKRRNLRVAEKNEAPIRTYADECNKIQIPVPEGLGTLQFPDTYSFTPDRKIVRLSRNPFGDLEESPVCGGLILPGRRIENVDQDSGVYYQMLFFKNERWYGAEVPKKTLIDPSRVTDIAQFDAPISGKAAKTTTEFMAKTITLNADRIPTVQALQKNGWTKTNDAFGLDLEIISDSDVASKYRPACHKKAACSPKRGASMNGKGLLDSAATILFPCSCCMLVWLVRH
jgi:hypothetical protein